MTDRPALRAKEGIPSRPIEHRVLSEARVSSHQAGVVVARERVDGGGVDKAGGDGRQVPEAAAEDIETKCVFRVSATEVEFMLKQDQFSCGEEETPAALRVFQRVEGSALFQIRQWKYSFLAFRCSAVTRFLCVLNASHVTVSG